MPSVDSKGRIVLPKEIRDRLDLSPGSDVAVELRESDQQVVVEPEPDPEETATALIEVIESESPQRDETTSPLDDVDPIARDHLETVRRAASTEDTDG